jgi:hypothetical protein
VTEGAVAPVQKNEEGHNQDVAAGGEGEAPDESMSGPEPLSLDVARTLTENVAKGSELTLDYDRAVDLIEGSLVEEAFGAIRQGQPDGAIQHLAAAEAVRNRYFIVLDEAATEPDHEFSDQISGLRKYAEEQRTFLSWLGQLADALLSFRKGEWNLAVQRLDHQDATSIVDLENPEFSSLMAASGAIAGEILAGEIRGAVQDFGGARAAYDRAIAFHHQIVKTLEKAEPGSSPELPLHPLLLCEGGSLRMQLSQLLQANDYVSAVTTAQKAADCTSRAADRMEEEDPPSNTLAVPLLRAQSMELLAIGAESHAELALAKEDWKTAEEQSQAAVEHYSSASKEALRSTLPQASVVQEKLLNAGFNWGVQFRRRFDREREASRRYEAIKKELVELNESIRRALTPAGVTVNTQAELVNSVHQQVETVSRVEVQAREVLREVPEVLRDIKIPAELRLQLESEARSLADSQEAGSSFLDKVRRFASSLERVIDTTAEASAPILAFLKALAMLG